jgi:hypothetical protein
VAQGLFRQQALERFSSPDQVDQAMYVTSPRAWLVLVAFLGVLAGAILWVLVAVAPRTTTAPGAVVSQAGSGKMAAVIFVDADARGNIHPGQKATIRVGSGRPRSVPAKVISVSSFPASRTQMEAVVRAPQTAQILAQQGYFIPVRLEARGRLDAAAGTPATGVITVAEQRLFNYVVP